VTTSSKQSADEALGKVVSATLASAVLPGAGQILLGRKRFGAAILALTALLVGLGVYHLTVGLGLFETKLGSFLFGVMLRAVGILYAFAAVDAYLTGVDPSGKVDPTRRRAAALNLLIPGAGYLLAKAWLRAATGLLVLVCVVYFARFGRPYLDVIFVVMQLLMGGFVYQQVRLAEAKAAQGDDPYARPKLPTPPQLPKVVAAQIIVLVVVVAAVFGGGLVVLEALPVHGQVTGLEKSTSLKKVDGGIHMAVKKLGLTMTIAGSDWSVSQDPKEFLFEATHGSGATINLRVGSLPPFVRTDRFHDGVRRQIEGNSLEHRKTRHVNLGGLEGTRMTFSRDHGVVAARRGRVGVIVIFGCKYGSCAETAALRERTLRSVKLER
jgi:hypothetical protein